MTCEHFDREGLLRQERGLPDPHVDGCLDCQASRATYRRLTDALADVGTDVRPRDGWEEEVLAKVRAPRRNRWWLGAGVGGALVAAAIVLLVVNGRKPTVLEASIDQVPSGSTTRGGPGGWTSGDNIFAISDVKGGAVWIYRTDEHTDRLVLGCDGASIAPPRCVRHGRGVRTMEPTAVGHYEVIAFDTAAPGPAPAHYDDAKAALIRTGGAKTLPIDVR
ncbi:MAG TPA: hypothetical protein VHE35_07700 [Kofleriaceae bacterium]|nr:hypothetical protein [Kofleriaceae bacterium]